MDFPSLHETLVENLGLIILARFADGPDDEFHFDWREEMSLPGHPDLPELLTKSRLRVNPEVEVVERPAGGAGIREI